MKNKKLKLSILVLVSMMLSVGLTNCNKEESLDITSIKNKEVVSIKSKETTFKSSLASKPNSIYYTDQCGTNLISPETGDRPIKIIVPTASWTLEGNFFVARTSADAEVRNTFVSDSNCWAKAMVMLVKNELIYGDYFVEKYEPSTLDFVKATTGTQVWKFDATKSNHDLLKGVKIVAQGWVWGCFGTYSNGTSIGNEILGNSNLHTIDWAEDNQRGKVFDIPMPTLNAPILTATAITSNSVTLSWTSSTGSLEVKEYDVYKNKTYLVNSTNTSVTINGLSAGTMYTFYVNAKSVEGFESSASNTVRVTTTSAPPATPTNLTINAMSANLTWNASNGATYYNIYRIQDYGSFILLATSTTPNYNDYTIVPGSHNHIFYYRVQAVNSNGVSGYSNIVSIYGNPRE